MAVDDLVDQAIKHGHDIYRYVAAYLMDKDYDDVSLCNRKASR